MSKSYQAAPPPDHLIPFFIYFINVFFFHFIFLFFNFQVGRGEIIALPETAVFWNQSMREKPKRNATQAGSLVNGH